MSSPARLSAVAPLVGACLAVAVVAAACVAASGAAATPSANGPTERPSAAQSSVPAVPSPGASGGSGEAHSLYLRAWQTQALAPRYTFGWLPVLTIVEGKVIDGRVAVPAIYPGPLWAGPSIGTISPKGVDRIVGTFRAIGLLKNADFTKGMPPGSMVAHISIVVDGKSLELAGDPQGFLGCDSCVAEPGSGDAFARTWRLLTDPRRLADELGPETTYTPERLAVLAIAPVKAESGIQPSQATWPLETPFASFGSAYADGRCAVVDGADVARLLPAVQAANQLTRFVDSTGAQRSLIVRAMVPREPSPCA